MAKIVMITTKDNPYDPKDQFYDWLAYDNMKGYKTCQYLDRVTQIDDQLPDSQISAEIERAIDEIIANDFMNIYVKKVYDDESVEEETI